MLSEILLSERTQALYNALTEHCSLALSHGERILAEDLAQLRLEVDEGRLSLDVLLDWLCRAYTLDKKSCFFCESFRVALLIDLRAQLLQERGNDLETEDLPDNTNTNQTLLLVAGVILVACEGFDGIATVLGVFPAISGACIFGLSLLCSLLSLLIYYGIDLLIVSTAFAVSLRHSTEMLDVCVQQITLIDNLRHLINTSCDETQDVDTLVGLADCARMLMMRFNAQDGARQSVMRNLQNPALKFARALTTSFLGVIFFCGGFGAGQTVASVITGLVSMAALTATMATIGLGIIAGLAAFAIYWYVERYDIEAIVSRWFGLDNDKIAVFAEPQSVERARHKLSQLQHHIDNKLTLVDRATQLEDRLAGYEADVGNGFGRPQRFFSRPRAYSEGALAPAMSLGLGLLKT